MSKKTVIADPLMVRVTYSIEIVCPYCNHDVEAESEYDRPDEEICPHCDKTFSIKYESQKK
jgi:uncharacterized Zn-finger protein